MSTSSDLASLTSGAVSVPRVHSPAQQLAIRVTVGCVCGWLAASFLDVPITEWVRSADLPGDLERAINLCEVFAHGTGVIMILITIGCLQPTRWRSLIWVGATALLSGLAADGIKLLVPRMRPQAFETLGQNGWESFALFGPQTLAQRFTEGGSIVQSFPSAHTATAFAFAIALTWYFGRGQRVFLGLAAGAALQRVYCGAHWPSDVVVGAVLGLTLSPLLLQHADRLLQERKNA